MYGYTINGISFGVDYHPYRKKPCLVIQEGNTQTKLASFNNDHSARVFLDKFADFLGAERYKEAYLPLGLYEEDICR